MFDKSKIQICGCFVMQPTADLYFGKENKIGKSKMQMCSCFVMQPTAHLCFLREINFVNRGNKIFVKEILVNRKYRCGVVLLSSQLRICASSGKIKCANLGCRCVIVLLCNRPHFYVSLSKILDQRRRWQLVLVLQPAADLYFIF